MNYIEQTRKVVDSITKQEKERYELIDLNFDIETPTVVSYYRDNLKKGKFSLKKRGAFRAAYSALLGTFSAGFASGYSNEICVFAKDYQSSAYFFSIPIADLKKRLPYQDMFVANTTFHEIRHIIQHSGYCLSCLEYFCCHRLSDYKGYKGVVNAKYHDSLFIEIDANLYGAREAARYFQGNKDIEEYFAKFIGKYTLQKYAFDFDSNLETYQKENEKQGKKVYGMTVFENFLWNNDGSFKKPREIMQDEEFNSFTHKYFGELPFFNMVLSSDAYISRLYKEELTDEEVCFIKDAIEYSIGLSNNDKQYFKDVLLKRGMINERQLKKATLLVNSQITRKKRNLEKLLKNRNIIIDNEESNSRREVELEALKQLEVLKIPEPPKKVKLITKAKNHLRSIIDGIGKIKVGVIVTALELAAIIATMPSITVHPFLPVIAGVSAVGAGVLASKIYKNTGRK